MNFSKPPPVPDTPTDTRTSFCTAAYSSTSASVIGATVEEPSPITSPVNCACPASAESTLLFEFAASSLLSSDPHAAKNNAEPKIAAWLKYFHFFICHFLQ